MVSWGFLSISILIPGSQFEEPASLGTVVTIGTSLHSGQTFL